MRFSNYLVFFTAFYLFCCAIFAGTDPAPVTQPTSNPGEAAWGAAVEGLRLRVTTSTDKYKPLEPVVCQIEMQNSGGRMAGLGLGYLTSLQAYTFDVVGPNGQKSPPTLWGKAMSEIQQRMSGMAPGLQLPPGQTHVDHLQALNRAFDMTLDGKYTVTVHRQLMNPMDHSKEITLDSNTVTITIADPPPQQESPTTKPKVWP